MKHFLLLIVLVSALLLSLVSSEILLATTNNNVLPPLNQLSSTQKVNLFTVSNIGGHYSLFVTNMATLTKVIVEGKMLIDSNLYEEEKITAGNDLSLDYAAVTGSDFTAKVVGSVAADYYCDENGDNCLTSAYIKKFLDLAKGQTCVKNCNCPAGQIRVGTTCVAQCQWNSSIAATDPSCAPPCDGVSGITTVDPRCTETKWLIDNSNSINQDTVSSYCDNLVYTDPTTGLTYTDWRQPTLSEILYIIPKTANGNLKIINTYYADLKFNDLAGAFRIGGNAANNYNRGIKVYTNTTNWKFCAVCSIIVGIEAKHEVRPICVRGSNVPQYNGSNAFLSELKTLDQAGPSGITWNTTEYAAPKIIRDDWGLGSQKDFYVKKLSGFSLYKGIYMQWMTGVVGTYKKNGDPE